MTAVPLAAATLIGTAEIGRLDSRGGFAPAAFYLQLHVPPIRRSIQLNSQA